MWHIPLRMMNQWVMYGFRIGRNASGLGTDPIDQVYSNIDPYSVAGPAYLHSVPDSFYLDLVSVAYV